MFALPPCLLAWHRSRPASWHSLAWPPLTIFFRHSLASTTTSPAFGLPSCASKTDLPANTDKLVQAEEQQAADLAAATEIHARVNSLVQANEAVVGLLSEKLVAWDQLLRHKEGQKR